MSHHDAQRRRWPYHRAQLSVSIVVDGGASLTCEKLADWADAEYDEYAECTRSVANGLERTGKYSEEITISVKGPTQTYVTEVMADAPWTSH